MNPVALQLAKGNPFAPTSWGAFGPHWLWVSPVEGAQTIALGTATERELANPVTPVIGRAVAIGQATEVELAQAITPLSPAFVPVQTATERELAQLITPVKGAPVQIGSTCEVLSPTAICEVTV